MTETFVLAYLVIGLVCNMPFMYATWHLWDGRYWQFMAGSFLCGVALWPLVLFHVVVHWNDPQWEGRGR